MSRLNPLYWIRRERRRIRTRAVYLCSYRRDFSRFGQWMRWELTRVVLIFVVLVIPSYVMQKTLGIMSVPGTIYFWVIIIAFVSWGTFFYWNVMSVFRRMSRRQRAYLQANGLEFSLLEVIRNPQLRRIGKGTGTTRDFIMAYRTYLADKEIRP